MKITKVEDGTFTITGIAPDALTRLLITVNAADCMNCGLLYECKGSGVNCGEWQRFLKPVVLAELEKESEKTPLIINIWCIEGNRQKKKQRR